MSMLIHTQKKKTLPWFIGAIVASARIFREILVSYLCAPPCKRGLSASCTEMWEAAQ